MRRLFLFGLALGLCLGSVRADETVQAVQARLKKDGFYTGETDGRYDSATSAAVTRYQIRNGLSISGELDPETLKALDVAPPKGGPADDPSPEEGTWRRLRNGDLQFLKKLNSGEIPPPKAPASTPPREHPPVPVAKKSPRQPAATRPVGPSRATPPAREAQPETAGPPAGTDYGRERLRDFVGAFVLAGLDPRVGAELEFFADRVNYFGEANVPREKIRRDLVRYDKQWPQRRFWMAGDLSVGREANGMLRVTFPLRYELRRGSKTASGTVLKRLALRKTGGGELEIVAVNETKASQR